MPIAAPRDRPETWAFCIPISLHERRNIVGENFSGIDSFRFVGFTRASEIERDACKVLGVFRYLERITGVIGAQVRNKNKWFTSPLLVIVHGDVVCFDLGHTRPPPNAIEPMSIMPQTLSRK